MTVIALIQQQQSLLDHIKSEQEMLRNELKSNQSSVERRLTALEQSVKASSVDSSSGSSSAERKKIKITRDLTVKFLWLFLSYDNA